MSDIRSFMRILDEVELAIGARDDKLDATDAFGRVLWRGADYDHRLRVNLWPRLSRHSQDVTLQDLAFAAEKGARRKESG